MKTILILTTGSRDVQLKSREQDSVASGTFDYSYTGPGGRESSVQVVAHHEHPESYALKSMRAGCRQLKRDYEQVRPFLSFPMIAPAVEYVLNRHGKIDEILFVVTDQAKEDVSASFKEKDTIHLPPLARRYLNDLYPGKIDLYSQMDVNKCLADIDYWYDQFDEYLKNREVLDEPRGEAAVYFLPQGGIDQINQALTLRLIEYYPELKQLQVPEGRPVRELKFPEKFLFNITRHKMREMAERYHFAAVRELNLTRHVEIDLLAGLGDALVKMDRKEMSRLVFSGKYRHAVDSLPVVGKMISLFLEDENVRSVQRLVYLSARIKYEQGLAGETLWRLATLNELLLKAPVVELLDWKYPGEKKPFRSLNEAIKANNPLFEYLKKNKVFSGDFVHPSSRLYAEILAFFREKEGKQFPDQSTEKLVNMLKKFLDPRNMLIHQAIGISISELDEVCKKEATDMKTLFDGHLGPYFNMQGAGLPGELKDGILSRL